MTAVAHSSPPVSATVNNKVTTEEAAGILGCSASSINNLRRNRKIMTAQMIEGQWFYDATEIYQAKASKIIKPRKRKSRVIFSAQAPLEQPTNKQKANEVGISLKLPCDKFDRIKIALAASNKTLTEYMLETFDALDIRIVDKLSGLA